jgi:uncharacterized protein YegJ (DUF2314 family)
MGDDIPSLKLSVDDKITIKRQDIVDWMIVENGKLIGAIPFELHFNVYPPRKKNAFRKQCTIQ